MNEPIPINKRNPIIGANVISKLAFGWILPLFYKGTQKNLELSDLFDPLPSDKSDTLGDQLEKNWKTELQKVEKNGKYKPSLLRAILKTFPKTLIFHGLLVIIIECGFRAFLPFVLGKVIFNFNAEHNEQSQDNLIFYAVLLVLMNFFSICFLEHTEVLKQKLGMQVRVACCSLVYRKVLKLSQSSIGKVTTGKIVNLLSNDVNRFDLIFSFLHYIWVVPLQLAIVTYLLWESVDIASLAGLGSLIIQTIPIQGFFGKVSSSIRMKTAKLTDRRILLMSEIIFGIQVIKMYAWEKPFDLMVRVARLNEMKMIKRSSIIRGISISIMVFTERTTLFLTVITYALLGHTITPDKVFAAAQYFNILQLSMASYFPNAIAMGAETLITIQRLREFLLLDEKPQSGNVQKVNANESIIIKNVTASWDNIGATLKDVSTVVRSEELCVVIGPVGGGKSSFLNLLLSELNIEQGRVYTPESISYCSQEPWLFHGTIRQNILFGQPYDHKKYAEVVKVCELIKDFEEFQFSDQTIIGDQGSSLSGGQKARINLARAVYRNADLYLLDDPLSAVDTHVGKHLFQECILKYLKSKTTILVTHQIQHLKNVNHIIVLNNGRIEAEGNYNDLTNMNLEYTKFLNQNEEHSPAIEEDKEKKFEAMRKASFKSIKMNDSDNILQQADSQEEMATGSLSFKVYKEYFKASGNICHLIFLGFVLVLAQVACNSNDIWLSYWTNIEMKRSHTAQPEIVVLNEVGGPINNTIYTTENNQFLPVNTYIYVYAALIIATIIITMFRSLYLYNLCMTASVNLHNAMFHNLLLAPMRFFDKNSVGRVLNRFSKDIGTADDILPKSLIESLQIFSVFLGILVMIAIVNPYLIILNLILVVVIYKIRKIFMKTAQDIRRLEGISRSPTFAHLSATVDGITTIRSCNIESLLKMQFDQHQDAHTSTWFLTLACSGALGFWVDILCIVFITIILFTFIFINQDLYTGSEVGLILSQIMILVAMTQYGIKMSAMTSCYMTCIERVLQYTNLPKEKPLETLPGTKIPPNWPQSGNLEFAHVYMKYGEDEPSILRNLTIRISSGEKIGIVGRTGAGKSSLISSLFHLSIVEGDIILDDVNTANVGLNELRSKISIIPQQPILFSASLRYNLDPFDQYNDAQLWSALEDVELKNSISSLDFEVQSGGSNFSLGQRQLICLARAILRKNKVLVMDEATANVDPKTDLLIQITIRRKFASCTVLTIAHRLNTIMDSDKVLVMESGVMVEYDHPFNLLQNPNGHFYKMVEKTGPKMTKVLHNAAELAFNKNHDKHLNTKL